MPESVAKWEELAVPEIWTDPPAEVRYLCLLLCGRYAVSRVTFESGKQAHFCEIHARHEAPKEYEKEITASVHQSTDLERIKVEPKKIDPVPIKEDGAEIAPALEGGR
jgi:hypothetical protein